MNGRTHARSEHPRWGAPATLLVLLTALCLPAPAPAINWVGGLSGDWLQATNWSPQNVPDAPGEDAVIPAAGGRYVTLRGGVTLDRIWFQDPLGTLDIGGSHVAVQLAGGLTNYGRLLSDGGWIVGDLQNQAGATVPLDMGRNLVFVLSNVTNDGDISVTGDGANPNTYLVVNQDVYFGGSGSIRLDYSGSWNEARISNMAWGHVHNEAPHSIRGAGRIMTTLTNNGTVSADSPGRTLILTDEGMTNNALMRAVDGGTLDISAPLAQGSAGVLRADNGTVLMQHDITGGSLETANGGTIRATGGKLLGVTNQGDFGVLAGSGVWAMASSFTNNGTVRINSDHGASTAWMAMNGEVTFGGAGGISLESGGVPDLAVLSMVSWGHLHNEAPHAVRGSGRIRCVLTNNSLVTADIPGRTLWLTDEGMTNNGVMRAENGGTLDVSSPLTQGATGVLRADNGTVMMRSDITGGTLETANGGAIRASGGKLKGVTNQGDFGILSGASPWVLASTIANNGTIRINSDHGGATAWMALAGDVHFTGAGEIRMEAGASPSEARISMVGWGHLYNEGAHALRGTGQVMSAMTNNALVEADVANATLWLTDEAKTNAGTMRATGGGTLRIECPTSNSGTYEAAAGGQLRAGLTGYNFSGGTLANGQWRVIGSSVMRLLGADVRTVAATLLLDGAGSSLCRDDAGAGVLDNWGAVAAGGSVEIRNGRDLATSAGLSNDGHLRVGSGCVLRVAGAYAQGAGGALHVALGEPDQSRCGRLESTGTATLRGSLEVQFVGYTPHPGDTLVVLTAGTRSGIFDAISCAMPGVSVQPLYTPTQVLVVVTAGPVAVGGDAGIAAEPELRVDALASGSVSVRLYLPRAAQVDLAVFDVSGRRVASIATGAEPRGVHCYQWRGERAGGQASSGVFFVRAALREERGEALRTARVVRVK